MVVVVLLPELSRALKAGDDEQATALQNRSLEFSIALTLPAAVGLIVIPEDIIRLVYERGAFDAIATQNTANALIAFASGLPAYVMIKVFQPAFFAREDMKTPFWFSLIMVATNVVLSLLLFPIYGHVGIAIATSVSAWVNLLLLVMTQWRRGDFKPDHTTIKRLVLLLVCSITMGATLLLIQTNLSVMIGEAFLIQLLFVGGMIAGGAGVYFGMALLIGAIDRSLVKRLLRR